MEYMSSLDEDPLFQILRYTLVRAYCIELDNPRLIERAKKVLYDYVKTYHVDEKEYKEPEYITLNRNNMNKDTTGALCPINSEESC